MDGEIYRIIIFANVMGKVFKYLIFSAIIIAFSAVVLQRDCSVVANQTDTFNEVKELCDECTQYQHSIYRTLSDIAVTAPRQNFSSNIRQQSGGKRTGQGGSRFNSDITKQGKSISEEVRFVQAYFKYSISKTFAKHGALLIKLGKLII